MHCAQNHILLLLFVLVKYRRKQENHRATPRHRLTQLKVRLNKSVRCAMDFEEFMLLLVILNTDTISWRCYSWLYELTGIHLSWLMFINVFISAHFTKNAFCKKNYTKNRKRTNSERKLKPFLQSCLTGQPSNILKPATTTTKSTIQSKSCFFIVKKAITR